MCGAGMAQPAQLALPLLPYKLLHAYKLAEYGHLTQALQYLGLVRASLGSLGNKMPAALLVCNGMAAELEQRLRAHAAVSLWPPQSVRACKGFGTAQGRIEDCDHGHSAIRGPTSAAQSGARPGHVHSAASAGIQARRMGVIIWDADAAHLSVPCLGPSRVGTVLAGLQCVGEGVAELLLHWRPWPAAGQGHQSAHQRRPATLWPTLHRLRCRPLWPPAWQGC